MYSGIKRQLSQQPALLDFVDSLKNSRALQMRYVVILILPALILDVLFIVCRKKNLLRFIYDSFETPIFWKLIVCAAINMAHSVAEMGSYGIWIREQ